MSRAQPLLSPKLLRLLAVLSSVLFVPAAGAAEWQKPVKDERFGRWAVTPFVELDPGFATERDTVFSLELSGIGRENLEIDAVRVNGDPLPAKTWKRDGRELRVQPGKALRKGYNRVTLAYRHPHDIVRFHKAEDGVEHDFHVNFQPDGVPGIRVAEQGHLLINGDPLFVRGSYRSGQTDDYIDALPSAAEAGFNVVHDYRFDRFDYESKGVSAYIDAARNYLDAARDNGLGVFLAIPRDAVNTFDEDAIARMVSELSDHPALLLWYLYDEPYPSKQPVWNHAQSYRLIKRLNPRRPVVTLPNHVEAMITFAPFSDIVWTDRYPFTASGRDAISIAPIAAHIQSYRQILDDMGMDKPVWTVVQVHDNQTIPHLRREMDLDLPTAGEYRPTESEIRAQSHVALANGSGSLVYYWAPDDWINMKTDVPEVWASFSKVLHELAELDEVLTRGEPTAAVHIRGGGDKLVFWSRRLGGEIYIGIANSSVYESDSAILETDFDRTGWRQIQGDGEATEKDDGLHLDFPGAGTIVLCITRDHASSETAFKP